MPLPPWAPDLPELDLLLSVAELGSLGRAAEAHGIAQPSASARLARLERRIGVTLLIRSSQGSQLTPAGEVVVTWARQVVEGARHLTDGIESLREARSARLRVAASLTIAEYLLPAWLVAFRKRHPDLDVAASVENSSAVCEAVRSGAADLGFIESPKAPREFGTKVIGRDRLALVAAPDYPLARRAAGGVRPRDVPDLVLLLREPGSGTRDTLLHAVAGARGQHPALPYATELGSTTTILAATRAGAGVGVVSARAIGADLTAGTLVEVSIVGLDLVRPLRAIWLGKRPPHPADDLVKLARAD